MVTRVVEIYVFAARFVRLFSVWVVARMSTRRGTGRLNVAHGVYGVLEMRVKEFRAGTGCICSAIPEPLRY